MTDEWCEIRSAVAVGVAYVCGDDHVEYASLSKPDQEWRLDPCDGVDRNVSYMWELGER